MNVTAFLREHFELSRKFIQQKLDLFESYLGTIEKTQTRREYTGGPQNAISDDVKMQLVKSVFSLPELNILNRYRWSAQKRNASSASNSIVRCVCPNVTYSTNNLDLDAANILVFEEPRSIKSERLYVVNLETFQYQIVRGVDALLGYITTFDLGPNVTELLDKKAALSFYQMYYAPGSPKVFDIDSLLEEYVYLKNVFTIDANGWVLSRGSQTRWNEIFITNKNLMLNFAYTNLRAGANPKEGIPSKVVNSSASLCSKQSTVAVDSKTNSVYCCTYFKTNGDFIGGDSKQREFLELCSLAFYESTKVRFSIILAFSGNEYVPAYRTHRFLEFSEALKGNITKAPPTKRSEWLYTMPSRLSEKITYLLEVYKPSIPCESSQLYVICGYDDNEGIEIMTHYKYLKNKYGSLHEFLSNSDYGLSLESFNLFEEGDLED